MRWLALFFLLSTSLFAVDEIPLSPETNIADFLKGEVALRGFLQRSPKNEWFLTYEPNVKSCCIGTRAKSTHQIHILKDFDSSYHNQVAVLQGTMQQAFDSESNTHTYFLSNVKIKSVQKNTPIWTWLTGAFCFFALLLFYRKKYYA
jgi:hypothetical protein